MEKIKPLIISRTLPYLGGREVIVDTLIKSFAQRGKVCVLTPDNYLKTKGVNKYKTTNSPGDILKWAKKQNVTVINCHTFYLSGIAFYLSRKLKIPLVFTLHGVFINFYGKRYGKILKDIYAESDSVITVSDNYRKHLGKYIGHSSKLVTIKNGIDLKPVDKIRTKSSGYYRRKNLLPQSKFIVLIPARLTYLKGLNYLIEAVKKTIDEEILFIICSPKGRKNPQESIYKKELMDSTEGNRAQLKFLNLDQEKILEYYQSADVVVLPSLIEGLSVSILEALAFEKTVIASRVGGNPEIIKNGKNGYLIAPKNADAIKRKVLWVKHNQKKLSVGKRGRKMIEYYFQKDKMVRNYYEIFKKIANENK